MVQPTSPHLPKTLEFSFFPSFVPCSIVLIFVLPLPPIACSRLCILAKVSLRPPLQAGSKWEFRQPPLVQKRLQFHFSAAQGRCFLHVPYACRDAEIPTQRRSTTFLSRLPRRHFIARSTWENSCSYPKAVPSHIIRERATGFGGGAASVAARDSAAHASQLRSCRRVSR